MTPETGIYEYAKHGLSLSADKPALWYYGKSITYRELFKKIDNAADYLYSLGVRERTVVTIHLPNCPQAVIAIYAVAKLGGICNMVHAQTPVAALRENMAFTESEILITYLPECTGVAKTVFYADISHHMGFVYRTGYRMKSKMRRPEKIRAFETLERKCPQKGIFPVQTELAEKCVMYFHSSGTTGEPKTVMHCHSALNWSARNAREHYHLDDIRREIQLGVLPLFHGSGFVMDYHLGFSGGAQIVQMAKWDCELAIKLIRGRRITNITGVPQIFSSLLQCDLFLGNTLHQCFGGGDVVTSNLKLAFRARTGIPLYEGFGLTETVSTCCGDRFVDDEIYKLSYPNCSVAVLGADGIPTQHGIGEIVIASPSNMLGYLNDSEATKETLINWDEKVWVRTGDLGKIDEEGRIQFLERLKRIIIRNGYNIYPKEVESVITALPEVKEACVFGIFDNQKQTQIVCVCIVLAQNGAKSEIIAAINAECKRLLPHYAIPQQIYFVERLPRNDMAKVDLEKLEALLREKF